MADSRIKCSNCGEMGHTKVRCKQPVPTEDAGGFDNPAGFDNSGGLDNSGGFDNNGSFDNAGGGDDWNSGGPAVSSAVEQW